MKTKLQIKTKQRNACTDEAQTLLEGGRRHKHYGDIEETQWQFLKKNEKGGGKDAQGCIKASNHFGQRKERQLLRINNEDPHQWRRSEAKRMNASQTNLI